ncbi:adenosylcobinamide kinase [Salipaludibacillus neizhouensis]|uniref:Adenosylcobinamide kinase n=1 Tax=Salipaludibacillus neizhouensis TaxID=885475 RepID=A0A3A9K1G0_9BACI|nr:bifunctional adenosylcobinamide kinase/adenosylcobinamide-phosphate guanylyltransferase [Salipaludibacillus neizhouensis]RKL66199.1 adenosylcobinamide kinase [Salipaludibacillus neizhouensis]
MIVFISGGARSGKSGLAEKLALSSCENEKGNSTMSKLVYLATSKRSDKEMEDRITRHQKERSATWETLEEPVDIVSVLKQAETDSVILLDCLTIWLSNVMFYENYHEEVIKTIISDVIKQVKLKNIRLLIVSNDVNEEIPHESDVVNRYIYTLEKIHHQLTAEAREVIQVIAGIPVYWKG